jgi:hypothetical protein
MGWRIKESGFSSQWRTDFSLLSSLEIGLWGPLSIITTAYSELFPRGKVAGVKLTVVLYLVVKLRICGVIHPLSGTVCEPIFILNATYLFQGSLPLRA